MERDPLQDPTKGELHNSKAKRRFVQVYDTPPGRGESARYTHMRTFSGTDAIPVVIDGQEVGRVVVTDLFPEDNS